MICKGFLHVRTTRKENRNFFTRLTIYVKKSGNSLLIPVR